MVKFYLVGGQSLRSSGGRITRENQHQLTGGQLFIFLWMFQLSLLLNEFKELLICLIASPLRIPLNTSCKAFNRSSI